MPIAYEGNKPYIFISYSHRNSNTVMTIIEHLQSEGYRVWFDGGIEAGSEWPEYIADHLNRCECVLTFISDTFVDSQNCRRELNFALDLKKPVLNVYIEEVELTAGMRMQLGLSQAIFRKNFTNDAHFLDTLASAKILENCRDVHPVKQEASVQPQSSKPQAPRKAAVEEAPGENSSSPAPKKLFATSVLLELSYCAAGPLAMKWILLAFPSGMTRFLLMCLPHTLLALMGRLIVGKNSKLLAPGQHSDLFAADFFAWAGATLLAVIIGAFLVPLEINPVMCFLLSLGLNVAPAIIALVIHFTLIFAENKNDDGSRK